MQNSNLNKMIKALLYILPILFCSCGTVQVLNYKVESGVIPATVEVDGLQVCEATPCEVALTADRTFVGLAYSSNGYKCQGEHHISVLPKVIPHDPPYAKAERIQTCLNWDAPRTVVFDLNIQPPEPVTTGQFLKKINKIKYVAMGVQNSQWHSRENPANNSRASDFFISYGEEIFNAHGTLLLGELILGKKTPLSTTQFQVGGLMHGHYTPLSMFYLSGGLFYKKIENEFAPDGIFPYLGLGILLNSETIIEFWNVFKIYFVKPEDFTYQVGSLKYDFFLETGVYLHGKLRDWDAQNVNMGVRIYH